MANLLLVVLFAVVCGSNAQNGYNLPVPQNPSQSYGAPGGDQSFLGDDPREAAASTIVEDPITALGNMIPGGGVPGDDYPILSAVPETGFNCLDQEFPGYYADTSDEARCQVFHICQEGGRIDSFLCPNGTLFQQQYFVCDWWFNVDCAAAEEFFGKNSEIGVVPEGSDAAGSSLDYDTIRDPSAGGLSNSYGAPSRDNGPPAPAPSNSYGAPNRF